MRLFKNDTELRIVLIALITSLSIISYAIYDAYSEDVSETIAQTIAENLPEIDNSLAGR